MASDGEFEDDFYDTPAASPSTIPIATLPPPTPSSDHRAQELPFSTEPATSHPSPISPLSTSGAQIEAESRPTSKALSDNVRGPSTIPDSQHDCVSILLEVGQEAQSFAGEDTVQHNKTASAAIEADKSDQEEEKKYEAKANSDESQQAVRAEPEEPRQEVKKADKDDAEGGASPLSNRVKPDPEFLDLAQVNNENPEAEWRYDTSDGESSSSASSSSSDSSSDDSDDSDDEQGLLNPEEQMRMLMAGMDEDGDEGEGKKGARGEDEKPMPIIPKPDLVVTKDMAIVELGEVESAVDRHILVKAKTTGTYRVLDQGSPLCLADRTVIGAINDLIGKVVQPYYVVGFETAEELADSGLTAGTTIYYVLDHAEFALVQPLMEQKHYDTNAVDEKVGEEDVEFSDDEKEAAYKASLKAKKRERYEGNADSRGNRPAQRARHSGIANTSLQPSAYPTQIKYDEEEDGEELYVPLSRPDNLHDMMASGIPPPTEGRHSTGNRGGRPTYPRDRDSNHNGDNRFSPRGRGRGNDRRGGRGRGGNRGGGHDNTQRGGEDRGIQSYERSGRGSNGYRTNGDLPPRPANQGYPSQLGQHAFPPPSMPNVQQPHFQQPGYYAGPYQSVQSWTAPAYNGMPLQNGSANMPNNLHTHSIPNGYSGAPSISNGVNDHIPAPQGGGVPNMSNPGDNLVAAFQQQFNQFRATFAQQFGNTLPPATAVPNSHFNTSPVPPAQQSVSRDPRFQARQAMAQSTVTPPVTPTTQPPAASSGAALEELLRNINSGGHI